MTQYHLSLLYGGDTVCETMDVAESFSSIPINLILFFFSEKYWSHFITLANNGTATCPLWDDFGRNLFPWSVRILPGGRSDFTRLPYRPWLGYDSVLISPLVTIHNPSTTSRTTRLAKCCFLTGTGLPSDNEKNPDTCLKSNPYTLKKSVGR